MSDGPFRYQIDEAHCSYGNSQNPAEAALRPAERESPRPTVNASWEGALSGRAVVYLELNKS